MGISELKDSNRSLKTERTGFQSARLDATSKINALETARGYAESARNDAEGLTDRISYIALSEWAGKHADSFANTMGAGGHARSKAESLRNACGDLVDSINSAIATQKARLEECEAGISRCNFLIDSNDRQIRDLQLRSGSASISGRK